MPSGKIKVPLFIHEIWAKGGAERDQLQEWLEEVSFDKVSWVI